MNSSMMLWLGAFIGISGLIIDHDTYKIIGCILTVGGTLLESIEDYKKEIKK